MGPMIMGIARHVLTAGGGYLVASGTLDSATAEVAVGAIVTLVGVAWSIWEKKGRAE